MKSFRLAGEAASVRPLPKSVETWARSLGTRGKKDQASVRQTLIDIGAVIFGALFICATACSVPLALFLLLFCSF